MIVPDANVILYALTPNEHTSNAREAIEGADGVAVPALWRLEVANALAIIARRGLLSREQVTTTFTNAVETFVSHEHDVDPKTAFQITLETDLSAYDAEYVALARRLGCKLVTNDTGVLRKAPDVSRPLPIPSQSDR
ncbi:MAG: type II toxin-antitoxin system VapC family toxin [Spirochaetaceae bacterium]